jgi:hypothetical protein
MIVVVYCFLIFSLLTVQKILYFGPVAFHLTFASLEVVFTVKLAEGRCTIRRGRWVARRAKRSVENAQDRNCKDKAFNHYITLLLIEAEQHFCESPKTVSDRL